MDDDLFIWVHDSGVKKSVATKTWIINHNLLKDWIVYTSLVTDLSITFIGNDNVNLWEIPLKKEGMMEDHLGSLTQLKMA